VAGQRVNSSLFAECVEPCPEGLGVSGQGTRWEAKDKISSRDIGLKDPDVEVVLGGADIVVVSYDAQNEE
jgi:hypothetical protein